MPISPLRGDGLVDAPQVVVGELVGARHLEARDRAALRVEGLHDLVDRAVLAGGIDALEDDEDRPLRLGPESILELPESHQLLRGGLGRVRLLVPVARAGIELRQADARAGPDAQGVPQVGATGHRAGLLSVGFGVPGCTMRRYPNPVTQEPAPWPSSPAPSRTRSSSPAAGSSPTSRWSSPTRPTRRRRPAPRSTRPRPSTRRPSRPPSRRSR